MNKRNDGKVLYINELDMVERGQEILYMIMEMEKKRFQKKIIQLGHWICLKTNL